MNATAFAREEVASGEDASTFTVQAEGFTGSTHHLWLPVMGFVLIAGGIFLSAGYRVDDPTIGRKLALYLLSAAIGYAAQKSRLRPWMAWGVSGVLQAAAISTGGMMLAYAAASLDMPLIDDKLLRFDHMLGYHWDSYAAFVLAHQGMSDLLSHSYMLIFGLPFIVTFVLASTGQFRQINRYLNATAIAVALTAAIFAFCPALTAWDYLRTEPSLIQHFKVLPDATSGWERDLLDIRAGRGFVLHDTSGSGLTAFPSYHCIAGLIFVWALWPAIWLRLPVIIAASLLIASAPIFGGHYLADLVAGGVVTLVSVTAAYRVELHWHRCHRYQRN